MTLRSALMATAMVALPVAAANAQAINGLYIGGGAGANIMQREDIKRETPVTTESGNFRPNVGPAVVFSLGWGFGNGLRAEIEGDYRQNNGFSDLQGFGGPRTIGGQEQKAGGMGNVFYDFVGLVPFVQPYVGAGVGYQQVFETNLHTANFVTGASSLAPNSDRGSLAYQGIVGAAFPIQGIPGLAITAEYRFLGLADDRVYGANFSNGTRGEFKLSTDYNHSVLIGFRYAFGVAAPVAAAVAPLPAIDNGAKTFLVFFDWNKADLTARSEGIVRDAASYASSTKYTRIDVDGNTDTSGTPAYNQGLSERRAQVVAAELVRDGVPQSAISMHAYGDTKLLVATGPGVREPQNRRVEIVYH
jgi:opacity protein-like surface antigen